MSRKSKSEDEAPEKITRDDLEAKFRELTGDVNDTAQRLTRGAVTFGTVALVVILVVHGRNAEAPKTRTPAPRAHDISSRDAVAAQLALPFLHVHAA